MNHTYLVNSSDRGNRFLVTDTVNGVNCPDPIPLAKSNVVYDDSIGDGIAKQGRNNCLIRKNLQINLEPEQILAFGISCFPIQSNVAFSGNTIINNLNYSPGNPIALEFMYPGFTTGTPQVPTKTAFTSYYESFGSYNTFPDYGFPESTVTADYGNLVVSNPFNPVVTANVNFSQIGIICPTIQVFNI
jgi:hypothetical protein